jgi:hypothetical protein
MLKDNINTKNWNMYQNAYYSNDKNEKFLEKDVLRFYLQMVMLVLSNIKYKRST